MATAENSLDKPLNNNNSKSESYFAIIVMAIFALLSLIGVTHHEMWRDEIAHWLIITDRPNLLTLLHDVRYLAHPGLWHFCLYWFSLFTADPLAMQLFHWLTAVGVIYVFARFAPFSKLQKTLFSFGYFPLFEYGVISRNYNLGVLLLFIFCTLYQRRKQQYWGLAIILFLLANVNVYTLIIAISLSAMLLLECWFDKDIYNSLSARKLDLLASIIISLSGIILSVYTLKPPSDSTLSLGFDWVKLYQYGWIKAAVFTPIWTSYCPIPNINLFNFWNSNALLDNQIVLGSVQVDSELCAGIFSLLLLLFVVFLIIRKPAALFFYLCSTVGIVLFTYIFYLGVYRHVGNLFFVLIASLWLAEYYQAINLPEKLIKLHETFNKYRNIFLLLLLAIHFAAGIYALTMDYKYPFSKSRDTTDYIKAQNLDQYMIITAPDFVGMPIASYLDKEIFYLESNKFGKSIICDSSRRQIDLIESIGKVINVAQTQQKDILVLFNNELSISDNGKSVPLTSARLGPNTTIQKVNQFTGSIVEDENYYIYLIQQGK